MHRKEINLTIAIGRLVETTGPTNQPTQKRENWMNSAENGIGGTRNRIKNRRKHRWERKALTSVLTLLAEILIQNHLLGIVVDLIMVRKI